MDPLQCFNLLYDFLKSRKSRWFDLITKPYEWGLRNNHVIPMGYEFDIIAEFTDTLQAQSQRSPVADCNQVVVKTELPVEHSNEASTECVAHGIGKVLHIGKICIGHNHPMCANMVNNTKSNMLPTYTDINSVINVAAKLGSGWSFVMSSDGLMIYWTYGHENSNFDPDVYSKMAIECLQSATSVDDRAWSVHNGAECTNVEEYLRNCGVFTKYREWKH